ncbi:hypothetical protein ACE193_16525 [Bernardetia sp. OM2101]|uniref:hypothetical protein n=1 Tax=Bernardetia sp. OM2101 TaxID=3344876 RepID=UPI0035D034BD
MIKFLLKNLLFSIPFIILFISGLFFLPTTLESNNMLYASKAKRERLKSITSPKIVFIGGSSIAFGLDSKIIEEQLGYPVVNMGLHAEIGLHYMVLETLPYLKKGDIVIIAAEYEQFDNQTFYGGEVLPPLLFDIHNDYETLDLTSTIRLFPDIANYNLKKVRGFLSYNQPNQKTSVNLDKPTVYAKKSFNKYGDMTAHWNLESPKQEISNAKHNNNKKISNNVITFLLDFKQKMDIKGVKTLFVPPPYKKTLFNKETEYITNIDARLKKEGLGYITTPSKYTFPDSLFFDTSYHLNKKGVDKRTKYLIEDISNYINNQK